MHPMICIFVMTGKGMVSGGAAACAPGVECFFIHYSKSLGAYERETLKKEIKRSILD